MGRVGSLIDRLRRLRRDEDGVTAIEFAFVALPFFMLIFGMLELGMIFLISMTLDNATMFASRDIRTGVVQKAGGSTKDTFKTAVCNQMAWIKSTCLNNLSVDVKVYTSFQTATPANPIVTGTNNTKTFNAGALSYQPGTASQIVIVKTYFQWPLLAPTLNKGLKKLSNGRAVITSTVAFRNEPYE